ncbi:MAG: hypothetical protein QM504_15330 [Pseudomonadota bacterium]
MYFNVVNILSIAKLMTLHVPYVIEREFQTQQREIYSKDLDKSLAGLTSLSNKLLSDDISDKINNIKNQLTKEKNNVLSDSENQFISWLKSINANRLPLCIKQAQSALDSYFDGKPPFKSIKKRDDIPDGFIYQSVMLLAEEATQIHVVSDDNNLRAALDSDRSVFTYKSLPEFIESKLVQDALKEVDLVNNIDAISESLERLETSNNIITETISSIIGQKILWKDIGTNPYDEYIINGYYEPESIQLDFDDFSYYGNGKFGVPFTLNIMVSAVFYILKSEYYSMQNDGVHLPSVTDNNEYTYEAEDEFNVKVEGTVSIDLSANNIDLNDIKKYISDEEIVIDYIDDITIID